MEKRLKQYLQQMQNCIEKWEKDGIPDKESVSRSKRELLTQITFFQHERLIHLIVTVLFALMTIMTVVAILITTSIEVICLLVLLLVLLIPYVRHYYILENGTQKLYEYYDKLEELSMEKKIVAFTFDDGPVQWSEDSSAMSILHTLEQYKQHATYFYVGQQINEENVKELAYAKRIGCEIGNHGYTHSDFTKLTTEEIEEEFTKTEETIQAAIKTETRCTRMPYLAYDEHVLQTIPTPLISCSIDTRDWDKASTEEIIEAVMKAERRGELNGAIILMHEPYYTTASAVQYLVPTLLKLGYQIVSVSELAALRGVTLKAHHVYTKL